MNELLRRCRRLIDTAGFYFEVDAKMDPRRRTGHLMDEARQLLVDIDEALEQTEPPEAGDGREEEA